MLAFTVLSFNAQGNLCPLTVEEKGWVRGQGAPEDGGWEEGKGWEPNPRGWQSLSLSCTKVKGQVRLWWQKWLITASSHLELLQLWAGPAWGGREVLETMSWPFVKGWVQHTHTHTHTDSWEVLPSQLLARSPCEHAPLASPLRSPLSHAYRSLQRWLDDTVQCRPTSSFSYLWFNEEPFNYNICCFNYQRNYKWGSWRKPLLEQKLEKNSQHPGPAGVLGTVTATECDPSRRALHLHFN